MNEEMVIHQQAEISADVFSDKEAFNQLVRVASAFSKTSLVPEAYRGKPEDCMVAIDMANRMGMPPLMVMQNLYVVKGKPSWSGQACMSMIHANPRFSDAHPVFFGEKGADSRGCRIEAIRVSDGEMVYGTDVTISMAKAEGWMSNSKWKNMPEQMLAYRAAAFFARVYCPDALMGIQVEGEAEDISLREKRVIGDVLTDNEPTDPKPSTKAASDPLAGEVELL
jgi:hypothetical protein